MANILLAIWLILFGVLALVSTRVPEWIVPLLAIVVGLVILVSPWWKRGP